LKVFDPKALVWWYQLKEQTKNSEKLDVSRLTTASVAVTKRAHLTAQVRTVENRSVANGRLLKTLFVTSNPQPAARRRPKRLDHLSVAFPRVSKFVYYSKTVYATVTQYVAQSASGKILRITKRSV